MRTALMILPGPTLDRGLLTLYAGIHAADTPLCDCHPAYHELGVHAPGQEAS